MKYCKVGIVGSRERKSFHDYQLIDSALNSALHRLDFNYLEDELMLFSGGADGIDTLAERAAKERKFSITIQRPNYIKYEPRQAPLVRNLVIAGQIDALVAAPNKQFGGGTNYTINAFLERQKDISKLFLV